MLTEVPINIKEYKATEERKALQGAEHVRGGVFTVFTRELIKKLYQGNIGTGYGALTGLLSPIVGHDLYVGERLCWI